MGYMDQALPICPPMPLPQRNPQAPCLKEGRTLVVGRTPRQAQCERNLDPVRTEFGSSANAWTRRERNWGRLAKDCCAARSHKSPGKASTKTLSLFACRAVPTLRPGFDSAAWRGGGVVAYEARLRVAQGAVPLIKSIWREAARTRSALRLRLVRVGRFVGSASVSSEALWMATLPITERKVA